MHIYLSIVDGIYTYPKCIHLFIVLHPINTINYTYLRCFNNEMSIFESDCCLQLNMILSPRPFLVRFVRVGTLVRALSHDIHSGGIFRFSNIVWERDHKHGLYTYTCTTKPRGHSTPPGTPPCFDFRAVHIKVAFIYYTTILFIYFWVLRTGARIWTQRCGYRPASVYHRKPNLVHTVHMHFKNNNIVNRYHA